MHFGFLPCSLPSPDTGVFSMEFTNLPPLLHLPGAAPAQLNTETLGQTLLRAWAGQPGGLD